MMSTTWLKFSWTPHSNQSLTVSLKTLESTPQLSTNSREYSSGIAERTLMISTKLSCKWPSSLKEQVVMPQPEQMSHLRMHWLVKSGISLSRTSLRLTAFSERQLRTGFSIKMFGLQPGTMAHSLLSLHLDCLMKPTTIESHSRINLEPLEHKQLNRLIV